MMPEGYEMIKYTVHKTETWAIKDQNNKVWFPISELFRQIFLVKGLDASHLSQKQKQHTIRLRMIHPRAHKFKDAHSKPKSVIVFGDLWCIKNLIRNRFPIKKEQKTKIRDILIEEFAEHWGFSVAGFGILTNKNPYEINTYPFIEQLFIAAENNQSQWLRCIECERYYPKTENFYGSTNSTCNKCLGKGFKMKSADAYHKVEEFLKKRGKTY